MTNSLVVKLVCLKRLVEKKTSLCAASTRRTLWLVGFFAAICIAVAPEAMAAKPCTCVASLGGWNSGIVHNYGVIKWYPNLHLSAPRDCSKECSILVSGKSNIGDANALCAKTNWKGGCVHGYGYIGSIGTNNPDGTAGKLVCTAPVPEVIEHKCPPGWISNTNQQMGGATTDGKCKRLGCQPLGAPLPPDGTPLGNWGFSWGNALYQWGNAGNGGKPIATVISPP